MKDIIIAHIHSSNNQGVCTGHYMSLASLYVNLLSDYCHVKIAGGPLYANRFVNEDVVKLPHSIDVKATSFVCVKKMITNAKSLFSQTKGQIVILQDGKPVANHICILFCYKKCDLFLIKYHTDGVNKVWKKILFFLIKNRIKGVICPNDAIGQAHGLPYCVVPDYIYTGDSHNNNWKNFDERYYDFGCIGRIEPEKGIIDVARKFKGTQYKLLIAGNPSSQKLETEIKEICDDAPNIELRLGYLSDEDYDSALNNIKYALLNYKGVYANRSSGVVYDMLFNGIPVVGNNCGALNFVRENQVGFIYNSLSDFDPNEVMSKVQHTKYLLKIEDYCDMHKKYKKKLTTFLGL